MRENNKRVMRGEEPLQGSKNEVKDMPPQFKKWVDENQDRIARAKTLPYFLRDNGKMTDEGYVLNMGTQPPQKAESIAVEEPFKRATLEELKAAGVEVEREEFFNGTLASEVDFDKLKNIEILKIDRLCFDTTMLKSFVRKR